MGHLFGLIEPVSKKGKEFCEEKGIEGKEIFEFDGEFPENLIVHEYGSDEDGGWFCRTPFGDCMVFSHNGISELLIFEEVEMFFNNDENEARKEKIKFAKKLSEGLTGDFAKYGEMLIRYVETDGKDGYLITRRDADNILASHEPPDIVLNTWDGE